MAHGTYQDQIKRASAPLREMRVADLVFVDAPYPGLPKVFTCSTLSASINQQQCVSNVGRASSCTNCPVGKHFIAIQPPKAKLPKQAEFGSVRYANHKGMPCVRCGADGTGARLVGRMRLVHQVNRWLPDSVDALSVDVSCHNREKEIIAGRNSKGAKPVRHASLRETVATYRVGKKLYSDIAIGMRSGIPEIRRLLARGYPDSPVELISATMGGIDISVDSLIDPLFRSTYVKPSKKAAAPSTTLAAVLADLEDSVPSRERHTAPNTKRARKPREPRIEALHDFGFPRDIDDLAAWLLDEITPRPSRAVEPSVPVVATVKPAEAVEPVTVDFDAVADDISNPEPIADEDGVESERTGYYVVRNDSMVTVRDYAREHAISEDDAATALGFNDTDFEEVPEPEAVPAPEPVKVEPIPKKLTGKQARKLEKAQRREERQQQQFPNTRATQAAIGSRSLALVAIYQSQSARKA